VINPGSSLIKTPVFLSFLAKKPSSKIILATANFILEVAETILEDSFSILAIAEIVLEIANLILEDFFSILESAKTVLELAGLGSENADFGLVSADCLAERRRRFPSCALDLAWLFCFRRSGMKRGR